MRLMCPNCDAEYEVDASAIPETGRDVQCSNCGHAWFQHHPELEADQEAESALYDPPPPLSKAGMAEPILPSDLDWQVESDDPEAILDAMGRDAPSPAPAAETKADIEGADHPPKHDIDPEALRILREEAEFETAQRALEQGRADPAVPPVIARRVARLKGIQPPAPYPSAPPASGAPTSSTPTSGAPTSGARLPKIETVSASLRNDDLLPSKPYAKPKSGRGGLFAVVIPALAATAAYVFSPDLSVLLPSLAKPLGQYVAFVDGLRDQLDVWLPKGVAVAQSLLTQVIALVKGWF